MKLLRSATARRESRPGTVVLLLAFATALAMPVDVVWCQGSSGHSALELAWSECCAPADGNGSCTASSAPLEPTAGSASLVPGKDRCADLWLGGPVAVSPSPTTPPQGLVAMAAPGAVASVAGDPGQLRSARIATPNLRQVRELITTTILTI